MFKRDLFQITSVNDNYFSEIINKLFMAQDLFCLQFDNCDFAQNN